MRATSVHGVEADFLDGDEVVVDEVWAQDCYTVDPATIAGRVVVDLGANVGAFSLWAARHGAREVVAYEPMPANAARLRANVDDAETVVVIEAAVTAHAGRVWMVDRGADSAQCGFPFGEQQGDAVSVVGVDFDGVLRDAAARGPIGLVKIDIEGGEYDIVDGVDGGLLAQVDMLIMEFHGPGMWGGTPTEGELADQADRFGRMVVKLAEHGGVHIAGRPSVGGLLRWWPHR